jgi:hypothetical protein
VAPPGAGPTAPPAQPTAALAVLSNAQKSAIVANLNSLRAGVGATAMTPLSWDDNLANFAGNLAKECAVAHTTSDERKNVPGWVGTYVGENVAGASASGLTLGDANNATKVQAFIDQGVGMWWGERQNYDIASGVCQPGAICGHYTQLVWSSTSKVGCAVSMCTPQKTFNTPGFTLVCEFGAGGNMPGKKPYIPATP